MKKKLILAIACVFIPLMGAMGLLIGEESFRLSLQREQERAQVTQSLILREVQQTLGGNARYEQVTEAAASYRYAYAGQKIELIFCYGRNPLAGAALPGEIYGDLLNGGRCALLDTRSEPQRYTIAEPIDADTTLLMLLDVSDLYGLRGRLRRGVGLITLGVALAVLGLSWLIAARFLSPVQQLTAAARALAANPDARPVLPKPRRDEVGVLTSAFSQMHEAVRTREAALKEEAEKRQALLDALSHEMRTPLCTLLGDSRLMAHPGLTQAERETVSARMAGEIRRLSQMDEQLMQLLRLRHEEPLREDVPLLPLLRQTAERLRAQSGEVDITVEGGAESIPGDPLLLSLLADNLTVNALRASSPGSTVCLRTISGGFSVTDTGVGMTPEQLQNACEPFWKADKARTRQAGGAGLGLSLCKAIAEAHGGTLTLRSAFGQGTTASFTTPLRPCDDTVTHAAVSSSQEVKLL